jgi:hypothetical protein
MQAHAEGGRTAPTYSQLLRYMGVGGLHHAPAALNEGKIRYTLYRRLANNCGTIKWQRSKKHLVARPWHQSLIFRALLHIRKVLDIINDQGRVEQFFFLSFCGFPQFVQESAYRVS